MMRASGLMNGTNTELCISTLEPSCYNDYAANQEVANFFQKTVDLFRGLDSYTVSLFISLNHPERAYQLSEMDFRLGGRGADRDRHLRTQALQFGHIFVSSNPGCYQCLIWV